MGLFMKLLLRRYLDYDNVDLLRLNILSRVWTKNNVHRTSTPQHSCILTLVPFLALS